MTEKLLQYIWKHQYFNRSELTAGPGLELEILEAGKLNTDQGPDFLEARLRVGQATMVGNVELHLLCSDWFRHDHSSDPNYQNIILHVVWQDDCKEDLPFPIIELKDRVPKWLLSKYERLMFEGDFIPCARQLKQVLDIDANDWLERLAVERLVHRGAVILSSLLETNQHWEEVFWWMLARNFGMPVNSEGFEAIAKSIPVKLLSKHKQQVIQLEALLLGQAGLLDGKFEDPYCRLLANEYRYLFKKWGLNRPRVPVHFLRMRPMHFPTVRLAQLAALVAQSSHLFSTLRELKDFREVRTLFDVTANDFWHYHYRLDETSDYYPKRIGQSMIDNLIVNTVIPMIHAYGTYHRDRGLCEKAVEWLRQLPKEQNTIVTSFEKAGLGIKRALDSQAILHLKSSYCNKRRCLDCHFGNLILRGV